MLRIEELGGFNVQYVCSPPTTRGRRAGRFFLACHACTKKPEWPQHTHVPRAVSFASDQQDKHSSKPDNSSAENGKLLLQHSHAVLYEEESEEEEFRPGR